MEPSRVKVFNPNGEGKFGTQCEIDGKVLAGVRSVDFHISVEEVPQFTFQMYGMPDIEMLGDVNFQFTPKTVQEAIEVIRKDFHYFPESGSFKALAASIEERLRIHIPDQTDVFRKTLAKEIVNQIFDI